MRDAIIDIDDDETQVYLLEDGRQVGGCLLPGATVQVISWAQEIAAGWRCGAASFGFPGSVN